MMRKFLVLSSILGLAYFIVYNFINALMFAKAGVNADSLETIVFEFNGVHTLLVVIILLLLALYLKKEEK